MLTSSTAPEASVDDASVAERVVAGALLVGLALLFLVSAWPRITAPFADSDDGINGAVWGYDSRSLRELGIVDSRLGGVRIDGTLYATHPPLIVVETAAIESIVGEHPWSTRAAAWLGALVSIALLYLIVRALGLAPVPAAAATVAGAAGHMLLVYGGMLDTMITSFPFALATALVWYRQYTGVHRLKPGWVLALATITCLGGWQAIFLVGLCGVALAARFRSQPSAVRDALPYLAAVIIGVGLTLAWAYWVYGSFSVLDDKLTRRTGGGESISIGDMVSFQMPWLGQLLGVGFLAWVACAVSLRDARFRPLAALSLSSVILYALFLKEGSAGHQYWNYWGLFPAVVGCAYVMDALVASLARRFPKDAAIRTGTVIGLALLVVAINLTRPNQAAGLIEDGYAAYEAVDDTDLGPGQTALPYVGEPYRADDWLRYRGGPAGVPLQSTAELEQLAADHPDHVVLVLGSCAVPDPTEICGVLAADGRVRMSTAAELEREAREAGES